MKYDLHNMMWEILVISAFWPILLSGDIEKAFLQIQIREAERDALSFHWVKVVDSKKIETLRFARLTFGILQSPFVLEERLEKYLYNYRDICSEAVETIKNNMYYNDDLISKGVNLKEVITINEQ